jgi:hypothetical protein
MPTSVSSAGPNEDTTVFVSGSSFRMVPSLYQKVEKLRWQRKRGFPHLNANADVFELLLQFLMFGKLPETTGMTTRQAAELLKMIDPLDNVELLQEHVAIFLEAAKQEKKQRSSVLLRRLSSINIFKASEDEQESFASSTKSENESIDLFDSASTSSITQPTITLLDATPSKPPPPPLADADDDLIDLFGFMETPSISMNTFDSTSPSLQAVESADSSEASSSTRGYQPQDDDDDEPRKVVVSSSFSMETTAAHYYDPSTIPPPPSSSSSSDKLVSPYDDHGATYYEGTSRSAAATLDSSCSSSSWSFRMSSNSSSKSFRNMFQKLKNKGGSSMDVSRTHAELCASDYVL